MEGGQYDVREDIPELLDSIERPSALQILLRSVLYLPIFVRGICQKIKPERMLQLVQFRSFIQDVKHARRLWNQRFG